MLCPPPIQSISLPARATPRLKTHTHTRDENASCPSWFEGRRWPRGPQNSPNRNKRWTDYGNGARRRARFAARSSTREEREQTRSTRETTSARDVCDDDDFTCVSILALLVVSLLSETCRRRRAFRLRVRASPGLRFFSSRRRKKSRVASHAASPRAERFAMRSMDATRFMESVRPIFCAARRVSSGSPFIGSPEPRDPSSTIQS